LQSRLPSANAAATINFSSRLLSHFPAALRLPDSRSLRSPAWSGIKPAHGLTPARSLFPRRRFRRRTIAWPGGPTASCCQRYAGPIAEFILTHADATRYDILDFIPVKTWGVRVSTVALAPLQQEVRPPISATRAAGDGRAPSAGHTPAVPRPVETVPPSQPVPLAASPFFSTRTQ